MKEHLFENVLALQQGQASEFMRGIDGQKGFVHLLS
jgi:hypothetical protein